MASLGETRSWTTLFTGQVYLADVDLPAHIGRLMDAKGRISYSWLPGCLHEATHHWCYNSVCGYGMALLQTRCRRLAVCSSDSNANKKWGLFYSSFARAQAMEAVLDSLSEGLAIFMEMDVVPGNSNAMSWPMDLALRYAADQSWRDETKDSAKLINEALTESLFTARLRLTNHLCHRRKENLLARPLGGADGHYLAGYLAVKSLYVEMSKKCPMLEDRDLFVSFIRAWFYDDLGAVAVLLNDTATVENSVNAILNYFKWRWNQLLACDLNAEVFKHEQFTYCRASNSEEKLNTIPLGIDLTSHNKGALLLEALGEESVSQKGLSAEEKKILTVYAIANNQRRFFRIGKADANVRVTSNRRYFVSLPDDTISAMGPREKWDNEMLATFGGIPFLSGPSDEHVLPGNDAGCVEVYALQNPISLFTIISRKGNKVAAILSSSNDKDFESELKDFIPGVHIDEVEDEMSVLIQGTIDELNINDALDSIKSTSKKAGYQLCLDQAFSRFDADVAGNCRRLMEKDGVWGLLNHDTKLLRSLARLSLVSSFDPFLVLAKENEKKGVWPDFSCLQKLADFKIRTGFDFIETTDSGMLFFV